MTDPYRPEGSRPADRTVIVNNDRGRSGSGWLVAGIIIVLLIVGGFYLFGGFASGGGDVNINLPEVETPDVNIQAPSAPAPAAPAN